MKAIIKDRQPIADGTILIELDLKGQEYDFTPGQYFFLTLPELRYEDPKGAMRHFSIVNSPSQKGILQFATRLTDSGYKKTLNEIALGTEVEIGNAMGIFGIPQENTKPVVMIAGGIGITPFVSILRDMHEKEAEHNVRLFYSNRLKKQTAFLDELQRMDLSDSNMNLILTLTDDPNWAGEVRMVNGEFIKDYVPDYNDCLFMISGPPAMVETIYNQLMGLGLSNLDIRTENFAGY
jgi:ferredoxin-NADP reductase